MTKLPLLVVLGSTVRKAVGFATPTAPSCIRDSFLCHTHRTSSHLRDSLFNDIFEFENNEVGNEVQQAEAEADEDAHLHLPPKDYNDDAPPFSESESPRDRARRMEMARELQKVFYKEPPSKASSSSSSTMSVRTLSPTSQQSSSGNSNNNLPYGSTILRNLPTLTNNNGIQNASNEMALLPGYQYVWNIHNLQHCHMFHSILAGSAPWYFAHVHLPESSSNSASNSASSTSSSSEEEKGDKNTVVDNVQSYHDIQEHLKSSGITPLYGTLLRITDRRFRDEDGSIVLAVQAIDRIRVHDVSSMPGTYLRTDVQFSPDEELMRMYYDEALMSSASYLSSHGNNGDCEGASEAPSCPSAVSGAARAAAVADTTRVRNFEFRPIFLEEKPKLPSSDNALRISASDSNATKRIKDAIRKQDREKEESSGPEYVGVLQLVDYDSFSYSSLGGAEVATSQALKRYWDELVKETTARGGSTNEDDLFDGSGTGGSSSTSFFLPEPMTSSSSSPPASLEATETMEYEVWCTLDKMIRLLSMAASATVPLPSQLLALLPKRYDWPRDFTLENYAQSLLTSRSSIGQSPFVRLDVITSSNPTSYSSMRRAQRLSYAIWLLLDGVAMTGAEPSPPTRYEVLEMRSIEQRLGTSKQVLEGINEILEKMIPPGNQKDGGETQ
mmetsp:Transcript_22941/g.47916  ORF Transcript_22941/g.47916 Transcript_22941/m.47916 type:complete len:670 (+) Transcript_22941:68-2077(+)